MKFGRMLGLGVALLALQPGGASAQERTGQSPTSSEIEKADFFKPGFAPVRNARTDDVTIVYFFDYRCPTCRKYHADVSKALREEGAVRVIYRDTPMLGDSSDAAAYAAIAAKFQGRHAAMHDALMSAKGPLDEVGLRAAAQKAKVDWDRLQRDIKAHKAEMDELIARNFELAMEAGIYGTPAFIIGDALANGALDYAGLKGEISDARKARNRPAETPFAGKLNRLRPASAARLEPLLRIPRLSRNSQPAVTLCSGSRKRSPGKLTKHRGWMSTAGPPLAGLPFSRAHWQSLRRPSFDGGDATDQWRAWARISRRQPGRAVSRRRG